MVTVPFPFQSLMKLFLVSVTSGLLLYASPGIAAALLPHPLRADEMYLSLLVTMGMSIFIPLIFRLVINYIKYIRDPPCTLVTLAIYYCVCRFGY